MVIVDEAESSMTRRVRRRVLSTGKEEANFPEIEDNNSTSDDKEELDWARLPYDTVIQLFSCLNYRDRASLSSTCQTWRSLSKSPCLWQSLDLRAHKCDPTAMSSLASCCQDLQKLRFRGPDSADAIINLRAKNLREIGGDCCGEMTGSALCALAAMHQSLECIQIGPDFCEKISSDALRVVATCCPKLKKLRISGMREVDADAIDSLAKNCHNLIDIGFIDCRTVDETALGNIVSLRFLSLAGTTNIQWNLLVQQCSKLTYLTGLDVSRTDISPINILRFFSLKLSLKVLCALNCPALEENATFVSNNSNHIGKGKVLVAIFNDILKEIANLKRDKRLDGMLNWLEWIISNSLLRISKNNHSGLHNFWLDQGTDLLLRLLKSSHEDVQERAATALANFVITDNGSIDTVRAEAVMQKDGIPLLLDLAQSWNEGLQCEAAKAIAELSASDKVAKFVAGKGGISILVNLAKSFNRFVAEEAARALWNLSIVEEHTDAIAKAGGLKALIDLILKWSQSTCGEGVLERAAGALANLAVDDKCSTEIAAMGGAHALVTLARSCKVEGVQEQAARGLMNLASHWKSDSNNEAAGHEFGAIDALVQLIRSPHDGVRQEAAGALWNLSLDHANLEAVATAGVVEAVVALAYSCSNASHGLQERAAGALWGLSESEANGVAIVREGGLAPLINLARSDAADVHEAAAGALWSLAINSGNALRIIEEGGVPALVHLCSSSSSSKMARFLSTLALSFIFDGRKDESALIGTSAEGISKSVKVERARRMALKNIEAFVTSFCNPQAFSAAAASSAPSALTNITESARIQEPYDLRCSRAEIGRFVTMLQNPTPTLKSCAAFALFQFTIPGGRNALHNVRLLKNTEAPRVLRVAAAGAGAPLEAKIFSRIVLHSLEQHQS